MTLPNLRWPLSGLSAAAGALAWPTLGMAAASGSSEAAPLISLARLVGALLLVLLVFWGFAWLMRSLQNPVTRGAGSLRIVSALSIGHREKLVVVQAGAEQLLLGVTPGRIERLHLLEGPVPDSVPEPPADFRQKLAAAMSGRSRS